MEAEKSQSGAERDSPGRHPGALQRRARLGLSSRPHESPVAHAALATLLAHELIKPGIRDPGELAFAVGLTVRHRLGTAKGAKLALRQGV
jgi:hypothetical protein